ncbi:MAG: hypothetical protein KAS93_03975 [Gammaproteobacteria bacterium]|nr:hypothetical protein [Gammaproteobacteria bacterium]
MLYKLTSKDVDSIVDNVNNAVRELVTNYHNEHFPLDPSKGMVIDCCLKSVEWSLEVIKVNNVDKVEYKFFGSDKQQFNCIDGTGLVFDWLALPLYATRVDPFIHKDNVQSAILQYFIENLAIDGEAICKEHRHYSIRKYDRGRCPSDSTYSHTLCEVLISQEFKNIADMLTAKAAADMEQQQNKAAAAIRKQHEETAEKIKKLPNDGDDDVPDAYKCSITGEIMVKPVMTMCGQTYEETAITEWFKYNDIDPNTRIVLKDKVLIPNYSLKKAIAEYLEKHPEHVSTSDNVPAPAR